MSDNLLWFEQRFSPEPNSGCWLWTGSHSSFGYGVVRRGKQGTGVVAHRVSWQLYRGEIPGGMYVLHQCDMPPCVNPDHLFLGTHQDNSDDKWSKGRANIPVGERSGMAKLSDAQAEDIRTRYARGEGSYRTLAIEYGVTFGEIGHIVRGRIRKVAVS